MNSYDLCQDCAFTCYIIPFLSLTPLLFSPISCSMASVGHMAQVSSVRGSVGSSGRRQKPLKVHV